MARSSPRRAHPLYSVQPNLSREALFREWAGLWVGRMYRLERVVVLVGKLLGILHQLHYVHRSWRLRGVADALGRAGADGVHAQDRNCGGNQSGRSDDGDLAHLALLSETMLTILVAT